MKFAELHAKLRVQYGPTQVNRAETASEKIGAWLSGGFSVAAVFIADRFVSVHCDDGSARTAARMIEADGHNGKHPVKIKRIVL